MSDGKKDTTHGPAPAVPCPLCGETNNFTELLTYQSLCRPGAKVDCDHCQGTVRILSIQPITIIKLQTIGEEED